MSCVHVGTLLLVSISVCAAALVGDKNGETADAQATVTELKLKVNQQDKVIKKMAQAIRQKDETIKQLTLKAKQHHRAIRQATSPIKTAIGDLAATEETAELGASGHGEFNWSQCNSEGGDKDCARCAGSANGTLPCDEANPYKNKEGNKYSSCPDNRIFRMRKFFVHSGAHGKGMCFNFDSDAALTGMGLSTYTFPRVSAGSSNNVVFTKVKIVHPHQTSKTVGAILLKRLVSHTVPDGAEKADVMKIGLCVNCRRRTIYKDINEKKATEEQHKKFVNECLPGAIDTKGKLKSGYECTGDDHKFFSTALKGF